MGITDDECDFLFYLGLHDRRACHVPRGPGLSAGPDGWAFLAPDGIWWWKDASLARELDRRYREWDARGRPGLPDYRISFLPIDGDRPTGDPPPQAAPSAQPTRAAGPAWQIERRFYREVLTLD